MIIYIKSQMMILDFLASVARIIMSLLAGISTLKLMPYNDKDIEAVLSV